MDSSEDAPANPRGIPKAPFVDRVEDYVTDRSEVESTINSFKEMISCVASIRGTWLNSEADTASRKYQFMQQNTQRRAAGLRDKIPDIQKTLETVRFLKSRKEGAKPLETTFELNDTLFAKAEVPPTEEVYLWLGANVMLSYPIPEAEELLSGKLSTAKQSLDTCEEDLDFLREQITVC
jgi:prefoldin subunit 5